MIARRRSLVLAAAPLLPLAVLLACASSPSASGPTVAGAPSAPSITRVQILAINDFHGNLEPPAGAGGYVTASISDPIASAEDAGIKTLGDAGLALVPAGGASYLAAEVARLRAENANTVVVSAGDLTGASPLLSNLFDDEPTLLAMNQMGLDYEGVGNHDFDHGIDALRDLQKRAKFRYLAANVTSTATKQTIFPPYAIRDFAGGARVAFIGVTLEQTPSVTTPAAMKGLAVANEVTTVNALIPELQRQRVAAIVLLLHQGAMQAPAGTYDGCVGLSGDLLPLLKGLSPEVDVVVSAHTHEAYDCMIDGRLVTSAASYGRLVTKIDLTIDPRVMKLVDKRARNVPVTRDLPPDPEIERIIATYREKAKTITRRVVGYVRGDITSNAKLAGSASCETPLGDLIADSQREATGADIAFMNPGGIRADLVASRPGRPTGTITFAEAFESQPFGNHLVTMTLTGAQIRALLLEQFGSRSEPRILQPSRGFTYRYAYDRATRTVVIDPASIKLGGAVIDPTKRYRVTANAFLAEGGDTFAVMKLGTERQVGPGDLEAFTTFLTRHGTEAAPLEAGALDRVAGDGCK